MKRVLLSLLFIATLASVAVVTRADKTSNIKVITFDLFAALMDTGTSVINNVNRITRNYLTTEEANHLAEGWLEHYGMTFWEYNALARDPNMQFAEKNVFHLMLQVGLDHLVKKMNIDSRLPQSVRQELYQAWGNLTPWPKTAHVLSQLRNMTNPDGSKRFKLGVLSNGDRDTLSNATKIFQSTNNFQFDYIIGSSDSGLFKPDPLFYEMVQKISGYSKEQILHVGGSEYDARGAKGFGYHAALNFGSATDFINLTGNPKYNIDYFLKDIEDLLTILQNGEGSN